jgi:hypothetical protein
MGRSVLRPYMFVAIPIDWVDKPWPLKRCGSTALHKGLGDDAFADGVED